MSVLKAKSPMELPHQIQAGVYSKPARVFSHPNRQSMGQVLAGTGALVFEGEMIELPIGWNPSKS